jgi:hypothetical protein
MATYAPMQVSPRPLDAGIWAAAVTSLKMEKLGPFDRPVCEVEKFINARYNHGSPDR